MANGSIGPRLRFWLLASTDGRVALAPAAVGALPSTAAAGAAGGETGAALAAVPTPVLLTFGGGVGARRACCDAGVGAPTIVASAGAGFGAAKVSVPPLATSGWASSAAAKS